MIKRLLLALSLLLAPTGAFAAWHSVAQQTAGGGGGAPLMVTPILALGGSNAGFPSNSATNYVPFMGGPASTSPSGTLANKQSVIATAGTIGNLEVNFPTTISTGSYAISLNLGGSSQTLTCTVQSGAQTCNDSTHQITVAPGNLVAWQITPTSTPTAQTTQLQISATFTSTVGQESPLFGGANNFTTSATAINYDAFGAAVSTNVTTEASASVVMPTAGTIDQLYMQLSAGAGASATYQVTVEHGGSDTSLTCTTATAGSTCSDTTVGHAFTVAQGDTISLKICPSNTATCPAGSAPTARQVAVGVRWVPSLTNEALLLDGFTTVPTTNSTRFGLLNGASSGTVTTETDLNIAPVVSGGMTIKKLTVLLAPVPGGATTRAINLRAGTGSGQAAVGTPGSVTCTVTSAATTCTDNTNSYSAATGAFLNWQTVPTGTNAVLTQFKVSEVVTVP